MAQQPSIGAGALNGVPVSPEAARFLVHAVMYATSQLSEGDPRRPAIRRALEASFNETEPFGPFNDVFGELKRIGGLETDR